MRRPVEALPLHRRIGMRSQPHFLAHAQGQRRSGLVQRNQEIPRRLAPNIQKLLELAERAGGFSAPQAVLGGT